MATRSACSNRAAPPTSSPGRLAARRYRHPSGQAPAARRLYRRQGIRSPTGPMTRARSPISRCELDRSLHPGAGRRIGPRPAPARGGVIAPRIPRRKPGPTESAPRYVSPGSEARFSSFLEIWRNDIILYRMLSAIQCRMARAALDWTVADLFPLRQGVGRDHDCPVRKRADSPEQIDRRLSQARL